MKKILTRVLTFVMLIVVATTYATTHNVTVTDGGFNPTNFNALVGDTVVWITSPSNYYPSNSVSTSIPDGAASWNSGVFPSGQTTSFLYVITIAGTYNYADPEWDNYMGSFTVTASGPPNTSTFHNITITDSGFSPDTLTANVGDTVLWTASQGNTNTNNTASVNIPTDARPWSSGGLTHGQNFMYVITTPGIYNYQSNSSNTFTASFTVNGTVSNTHLVISTDNGFLPDSFSANVGDTVTWLADAGNLWKVNSFSLTIPSDAAPWSSGGLEPGQNFSYVITAAGTYNYESDSFYTLYAKFTVAAATATTTVTDAAPGLIFQNPFGNQLNIISGQTGVVTVNDLLGKKVGDARLETANQPAQLNMDGLYAGVYLIEFSNNGKLIGTYKAVKVN